MARKTTQQVIAILQQAQNVTVSAKGRTVQQLIEIVQQVGAQQTITIKDADEKTTNDLLDIARQSRAGSITFELLLTE